MPCKHKLFAFRESRAEMPIWFQPIVDTFGYKVLAHECLPQRYRMHTGDEGEGIESERIRSMAIQAAASQARHGLYFLSLVPSSIDNPELDMQSTNEAILDSGMQAANVVFEVVEPDLARDPAHSRRIRDYLKRNGFGFALSSSGTGAGGYSFQAVSDFDPDYISLDKRLIRNIEHPVSAPTIGKLVRMAEESGARVMAEGVDRVRTMEYLWLLGVRFMRGHLFGEPSDHVIRAATLEFAR
jgi:EAL domain-containing protein (putative c-di-GMP-specific phosphodiesterase class I)